MINPDPINAGIARKNENRAASNGKIPSIIPDPMVIPDLETPGSKAIHWHNPINRDFFLSKCCFTGLKICVEINIIPVNKNPIPTTIVLWKRDSMYGFKSRPKIIIGTVPITTFFIKLFEAGENREKTISFISL